MATINVNVSSKREASEVLKQVYESDRSSGYTKNFNAVSGTLLSAIYRSEDNAVEIMSNYYDESNLVSMFNI